MKFTQKYELLDPVPGEGGNSFQARQSTTGRDVTVHFLTGGETPENQGLLSRLRKLPLEALAKVIEVGDHNGAKFVVTIAPPYLRLDDWLTEHERAYRTTQDQQFTRAGAWKVPPALTGQATGGAVTHAIEFDGRVRKNVRSAGGAAADWQNRESTTVRIGARRASAKVRARRVHENVSVARRFPDRQDPDSRRPSTEIGSRRVHENVPGACRPIRGPANGQRPDEDLQSAPADSRLASAEVRSRRVYENVPGARHLTGSQGPRGATSCDRARPVYADVSISAASAARARRAASIRSARRIHEDVQLSASAGARAGRLATAAAQTGRSGRVHSDVPESAAGIQARESRAASAASSHACSRRRRRGPADRNCPPAPLSPLRIQRRRRNPPRLRPTPAASPECSAPPAPRRPRRSRRPPPPSPSAEAALRKFFRVRPRRLPLRRAPANTRA